MYKLKYHSECKGNTIFILDATEKLTVSSCITNVYFSDLLPRQSYIHYTE